MTAPFPRPAAAAPRSTDRPRRDGSWGFLASLLSLIAIGAHYLWWDLRLENELVASWASSGLTEIVAARERIATATAVISQVAAVLVVVVPIVVWFLRRSPWWPPLAITAVALLASWVATYPSMTVLRYPGG